MAKTNYFGALAAAAGALVAVALLVLMLLLVDTQPAGAAFRGNNGAIAYADLDARGPAADFEIYAIAATGGMPPGRLTDNNTEDVQPCYSPDGNQIVYAGEESPGGDFEIYTQSLSDPFRRFQLTHNNTDDRDPSWAPSGFTGGCYIAYTGEDAPGGDAEIFMIPVTGGTPTRVTDNTTPDIQPDWQPNHRRIAYAGKVPTDPGGDFEIYTVQRPSCNSNRVATPIQRTSNGTDDFWPAWAPDSQAIAFASYNPQENEFDIYTMSYMGGSGLGGTPRRVTDNAIFARDPSWQPRP